MSIAQAALGVLGTASGDVSSAIGTGNPGNIFNIASGAAFGAAGVNNIAGVRLNQELLPNIINIAIGILGFLFTFLKGRKR